MSDGREKADSTIANLAQIWGQVVSDFKKDLPVGTCKRCGDTDGLYEGYCMSCCDDFLDDAKARDAEVEWEKSDYKMRCAEYREANNE